VFFNKPTLVIDVGMNVGMSSLYFATKRNVVKVIGFEPVKETFARAQSNFALNEPLRRKIQAENFGLGDEKRAVEIDVSSERPGVAGIFGYRGFSRMERNNLAKAVIHIASADAIVKDINSQTDSAVQIVAKIDCEGAEYEIIDSLYRSGSIKIIGTIMMEWHRVEAKGYRPSQLVEVLSKSGFDVVQKDSYSGNAGMLYAFRTT
ncbi:MAG TPA: FkbM family methyltransferase, partial [Negativicutes bacterium]|nr:FkbM family methyltransferase [Negativicutes bacterium]